MLIVIRCLALSKNTKNKTARRVESVDIYVLNSTRKYWRLYIFLNHFYDVVDDKNVIL